jgi:nucleotide-binding universal stress UspA family protein
MVMEKLVVGYNDSRSSKAARRWAIHYAKPRDAEILLLYVMSSVADWELAAVQVNTDPIRHEFEQRLRGEWSQAFREAGVRHETRVVEGRPGEQLMHYARRERASLLIVGMSTRGTLAELFFGSTTHHLLHEALRPVVAVPPDWTETSAT